MLYLFVRPQREPLDMIDYLACNSICCDQTCDWVSLLVIFNNMFNYVLTQLVTFHWIDISSSSHMNLSNFLQFWSGPIESDYLLIFNLNYSDSHILPFTSRVEDGERRSSYNTNKEMIRSKRKFVLRNAS